jgi:hypothetical protein
MATYDRGRKNEATSHRPERGMSEEGRESRKEQKREKQSVQRDEKIVGAERFPRKGNEGDEE